MSRTSDSYDRPRLQFRSTTFYEQGNEIELMSLDVVYLGGYEGVIGPPFLLYHIMSVPAYTRVHAWTAQIR
jgi:hypothetical protein